MDRVKIEKSKTMLRIGIIGMQHAHLFAAFINGVNREKFEKEAPAWTVNEIKKGGGERHKDISG